MQNEGNKVWFFVMIHEEWLAIKNKKARKTNEKKIESL